MYQIYYVCDLCRFEILCDITTEYDIAIILALPVAVRQMLLSPTLRRKIWGYAGAQAVESLSSPLPGQISGTINNEHTITNILEINN